MIRYEAVDGGLVNCCWNSCCCRYKTRPLSKERGVLVCLAWGQSIFHITKICMPRLKQKGVKKKKKLMLFPTQNKSMFWWLNVYTLVSKLYNNLVANHNQGSVQYVCLDLTSGTSNSGKTNALEAPWSQRFSFAAERRDKREKEVKEREKTSGSGRCETHYHATIAVNQHHEIDNNQPITTHL